MRFLWAKESPINSAEHVLTTKSLLLSLNYQRWMAHNSGLSDICKTAYNSIVIITASFESNVEVAVLSRLTYNEPSLTERERRKACTWTYRGFNAEINIVRNIYQYWISFVVTLMPVRKFRNIQCCKDAYNLLYIVYSFYWNNIPMICPHEKNSI